MAIPGPSDSRPQSFCPWLMDLGYRSMMVIVGGWVGGGL